ncbi:hypothetical protein AB0P36_27980 [Streptomyces flavidovirens]|uniref:hypothetical protein n=1 Tax=Streptomyces flavidovirens TaxID=67298 RepID=UPI00343AF5B1
MSSESDPLRIHAQKPTQAAAARGREFVKEGLNGGIKADFTKQLGQGKDRARATARRGP